MNHQVEVRGVHQIDIDSNSMPLLGISSLVVSHQMPIDLCGGIRSQEVTRLRPADQDLAM